MDEDGDKWRRMEMDEEDGDGWRVWRWMKKEMNGLGLRLELGLGFRDRV